MTPQKQPFCPPKPNSLVISLFRLIVPWIHRRCLGGLKVDLSDDDLRRLKAYRGKPMLILPNHPTNDDPYVMFALANRLKEIFYYVAARELFNRHNGLQGLLMQWNGVYSVIRGAADRDSFRTTRELLKQGLRRLVIFIEGEVSNENDTLIPFEAGVIQLAFWALEDRLKAAKNGELSAEAGRELYLTPVAIKYRYHPGVEKHIHHALERLEAAVLPASEQVAARKQDLYDRILHIGQILLTTQERRLNITPPENASLDDRLFVVKHRLLHKMELFLDITPPPNQSVLDRIRAVRNKMDKQIYSYQDPPSMTPYESRMLELMRNELKEFYEELERVVNLIVLREGSLGQHRTPERYIDLIRRLEREAFGHPIVNPPRTAWLSIGEIFNLGDYLPAYEENKKQAVQSVAERLEVDMIGMLHHPTQATERDIVTTPSE